MENFPEYYLPKIKFQATPRRGYKIKGHARLTKERYLGDKESPFHVYDYLKFKTKTSSPINKLLRIGQAGRNTAKKTQVHSTDLYSTWELNLWTSSEALTRSMEDMEEERL